MRENHWILRLSLSVAMAACFVNVIRAQELPTEIDFSYADRPYSSSGHGDGWTAGGAMKITSEISERFAGCKITAVSIANGEFHNQENGAMDIFFTRDLNKKGFYSQSEYMDLTKPKEYSTYKLDVPYTLTAGEEFFVGFSVWAEGYSAPDYRSSYPVWRGSELHTSYPGGYYGYSHSSDLKKYHELIWEDKGYSEGMVCIKLTIEGSNLPVNLVELSSFVLPDVIVPEVGAQVSFSLINRGVNTIRTIEYSYYVDGKKNVRTAAVPYASYNESRSFKFTTYPQIEGAGKEFRLSIDKVNGEPVGTTAKHEASLIFHCVSAEKGIRHNMLIEEATGTGCGWCVRGIVGLDQMMKEHSDGSFIPIAAHYPTYNRNLAPIGYDLLWDRHLTHNPTCLIDRNIQRYGIEDPNYETLSRLYESHASVPAIVNLEDIICEEDGESLKVSSSLKFVFSENNADYRVAYVITEDGVGPYEQSNAYSGSTEEMGGWELLPESVDIKHNFVARIISNFDGTKGDIPSEIEAGRVYHHADCLSLENVTDINNAYIIAVVINGNTAHIENALRKKIKASDATVDIVRSDADDSEPIEYYDLMGRKTPEPQHGIFIRRQGSKTEKVYIK